MIIIKNIKKLVEYEKLIRNLNISSFQQTYENIYSIYLSNDSAITFIENEMMTVLVKKDEDIYECPLNIEPITSSKKSI